MAKKIDLSVIILNHNTSNLLRACLASVLRCSNSFSFEVIVVDNASKDDSVAMVAKEFPQVKLICSQKNLGFAAGNNLGLKKAQGRYLLFLNSDVEVKKKAFEKMILFMDQHPRAGAATPKTLLFSGGMDPDCHRGFPTPWASLSYFLGLEKLFPKSKLFGQYHQGYKNLDNHHQIDAGFGTFMIIRQKALKEVGLWDESYFFYGEDLDYFYRLKKAGWQVWFYAHPLLTHHKGASSGLRRESRNVTRAARATRLKAAQASVKAMEIFYQKFYQGKYPFFLTWLVILGIRLRGVARVVYHFLKP